MKEEEQKEKKLQAEDKLTDEQLNQCGAGWTYGILTNCQDTLGNAGGYKQSAFEQGKKTVARTLR